MTCDRCGGELTRTARAGADTVVGTVAALVEGAPVLRCPADHRRPPISDLPSIAMAAVEDRLVHAGRRWRRPDACGHCREPLRLPVRRTRRSVTVTGDGIEAHTFHLDVPMVRCAECGVEQIPTRSQADLSAAVAAAYDTVYEPSR